jgi:hypothetical protein
MSLIAHFPGVNPNLYAVMQRSMNLDPDPFLFPEVAEIPPQLALPQPARPARKSRDRDCRLTCLLRSTRKLQRTQKSSREKTDLDHCRLL